MVETKGSGTDYREKYRRAVIEQEQIEKQLKGQLDLLRKSLLRVTSAAKGLDGSLDSAFDALQDKFRSGSGTEIVAQLEKVNDSVDHYERSRLERSARSASDVEKFINNLLELQLPNDLQKSLLGFKKGISKRLTSFRQYPEILNELGKLQLLALESAANPEQGFWQRLKGGKTLNKSSSSDTEVISENKDSQLDAHDLADQAAEHNAEHTFIPKSDRPASHGMKEQPGSIRFDPGQEENYEEVAKRIAATLEGLVEKIEPNEIVKHKVDIVKLRIKRGMDWYVLAVTLEDIRDILLLRYLQTDQDFSDYLKQVNNQLQSISEALGLAITEEEKLHESANTFSENVSRELGRMRASLDNTSDLTALKSEISTNLQTISDALSDFKQSRIESVSLTDQLSKLVKQVHSIEQESQKTKEMLEEERFRATHDSLTGLPNREAYNERAFHEMQRFKRYCRPLTLAVCDIDKFKNINDTYGHQAGDKVIKLIAKLLSTRIRKVDFVSRYGGEEFVLLMPETTTQQALGVLDKIREVMAKTPFRFKESPVQITISFGLADFNQEDTVESVFERADNALYQAKAKGRNRCIIYDSGMSALPTDK